jgi:hypothetical protein
VLCVVSGIAFNIHESFNINADAFTAPSEYVRSIRALFIARL